MTAANIGTLAFLLTAIGFWLAPRVSRPGIVFGVTVPPTFRGSAEGQAIERRYKLALAGVSAAAAGALLLRPVFLTQGLVLLLYPLAGTAVWLRARKATLTYQVGRPARVASLTAPPVRIPGGPAALAGPLLIVLASALFLYLRWEAIPDMIVTVHRGVETTQPKALRAVLGPLAFVGALVLAFTIQVVMLARRTPQTSASGEAGSAERRFRRGGLLGALVATYLMASASWFAVRRAFGPVDTTDWAIWISLVLLYLGAISVWMFVSGQGGQLRNREQPHGAGDATSDEAWTGGLVYWNSADPAIFVERRLGIGWTPNFGNPRTWLFLALALGVPVLLLSILR